MTYLRLLIIPVLFGLITTTSALADNRQLADEVMEIHDAAMEKMTDMYELKLQLKELETQTGPSEELTGAIDDLQHAHSGMMRWMREYKPPQNNQEQSAVQNYLQNELEKIREVSRKIDTSLSNGLRLLKEKEIR